MRWIVAIVLVVHGAIHFMGFAKAFGVSELPQLTQPISREMGLVWLSAGLLVLASAVLMLVWPRGWWMVGGLALATSQLAIAFAWRDAWAGTALNVLFLVVIAHAWLTEGPRSFRAPFERDAEAGLARSSEASGLTEADLGSLQEPVRRYLRAVGAVGQPKVSNYRLQFTGRIRSAPDARWMPFEATSKALPTGRPDCSAHGDARRLLPTGEFTYGEFDIEEVAYNERK